MKVKKSVVSLEDVDIEFSGARLLTKEEAEALPERLRLYQYWWWTSSANSDDTYAAFYVDGFDGYADNDYADISSAARPVLIFESSYLEIGDRIIVAGLEFEVITDNLAFCLGDIGTCEFREDWKAEGANDYEKSDIKKFVDKWWKGVQNESR